MLGRQSVRAEDPSHRVGGVIDTSGGDAGERGQPGGPIKAGNYADIIAVTGDPLTDIDALRRVQFVMRNGAVFKKDGVITIDKLLHPGPVNGWRRR